MSSWSNEFKFCLLELSGLSDAEAAQKRYYLVFHFERGRKNFLIGKEQMYSDIL